MTEKVLDVLRKSFSKSGHKDVIELNGKKYFSSAETARILGLGASGFYAAKKNGLLPDGVRIGQRKYFSEQEIEAILLGVKK